MLVFIILTASCSKTATKMPDSIMPNSQMTEDLEFKKLCENAGYEYMLMKPTQDGKMIMGAKSCIGCMVEGVEHVCDKEKFMEMMGMKKINGSSPSVNLSIYPKNIIPMQPATLTFNFKNSDGKPLELQIMHEKLVHVIIVSGDFSIFSHIHPEDSSITTQKNNDEGIFLINYTFSKFSRYLIGVNFATENKDYSKVFYVNAGNASEEPKKDFLRRKYFDGYAVNISVPKKIKPNEIATIIYYFERNGEELKDMEPYLAAPMHVAILKSDLTNFIHTHAEIDDGMRDAGIPMDMHMNHELPSSFGPRLKVSTIFPQKGVYHIFAEFKHHNKVIVTSFMVEVE